jgi:hypothetical protein
MDQKCKCGKTIPHKRYEMGYKNCVECSTVEKYGCVDIVYHKTGNTIEIMDSKDAEKMAKLVKRKGFGSMSSLRGGSGGATGNSGSFSASASRYIPTREDFEKAGEKAMKVYEAFGLQEVIDFISKSLSDERITVLQSKNLEKIFRALDDPQPVHEKKTPHTQPEVKEPKPLVDPEIEEVMKNWKK